MKLKIAHTLLIAAMIILGPPTAFSQTTSIKNPEFEALAKKMLKALKKMDQGKFLECFTNRAEYDAMLRVSDKKIAPDASDDESTEAKAKEEASAKSEEVETAYMKTSRKYADNFFLFAKKNDNDNFDWAEMKLDSLKYLIIKNKNGISSTDVFLYTSIQDQPYKISLNRLMKVGDLPWKITENCRMEKIPTKAERQQIRAAEESKLGDINQTIRTILKSFRSGNRENFIALAGTEADQRALVEKMKIPGASDEQMEQLKRKMGPLVNGKHEQKIKVLRDAFDQSIVLIKKKNAILSEAEIVWNLPIHSIQLGMEIVEANGFIRDHSVYFTFLINLVKVNGRWIINHTTSISFVTQNSSAATIINDILDSDKFYKKL